MTTVSNGPRTSSRDWPRSASAATGIPSSGRRTCGTRTSGLMREAHVNLVTVGVFSWAYLEPVPGQYEFGWLDTVLDKCLDAGVAVDLATATASPPPWLGHRWPESLPVTDDGVRLVYGARQQYCPSSAPYRDRALALTERMASRYAEHDAVVMWHVGNEYGAHTPACWCDISAEAFRDWLAKRYDTLDELNDAWSTAFWSQRFSDWSEVIPPRRTPYFPNPTQQLDFKRFSSDALLELFKAERDVIRTALPRRQADHDQLHALLPARGLLGLGARRGRRQRRLVPRPRRPAVARRGRSGCRPDALPRGRAALAAHGAGGVRHQLASGQPPEVGRRVPALVPPAGGSRCRCRPALPVASRRRRGREVALRDAPPCRAAHAHVARGGRPRRRARVAAGGRGRAHRRRRRHRPGLVVLVGARARLAAVDAAVDGRHPADLVRAAVATRLLDRLRPSRVRPHRVRPRPRAAALLGDRSRSSPDRRGRRARQQRRRRLLLGRRRRARPGAHGRLPGAVAGPAGHLGRGVPADASRRRDGGPLDGPLAARRSGRDRLERARAPDDGRGGDVLLRRRHRRPPGGHAPRPPVGRDRLVRLGRTRAGRHGRPRRAHRRRLGGAPDPADCAARRTSRWPCARPTRSATCSSSTTGRPIGQSRCPRAEGSAWKHATSRAPAGGTVTVAGGDVVVLVERRERTPDS